VQGDSVAREFIPQLIEYWQQGRFPFDRLITRYDGIEQIDVAANAMSRGEVIKPVVVIDPDYEG
jgi:aryl-alcohol dehydrogenase